MKKKPLIRVVLVLLCTVMLCSIPAHAAETRASERIALSASTIGKGSSGVLSAYFMVQANDVMDIIGATTVEIQRYTFTGWVTEYTFTCGEFPGMITTNSTRHAAELLYKPIFPEKTYRAIAYIVVEDATGITTQKVTSTAVT